jgi:hypothetical protein
VETTSLNSKIINSDMRPLRRRDEVAVHCEGGFPNSLAKFDLK